MMSTAEVYNEDMRRKALKASGDDLIRRRDVINAIFDAPIADLSDVTVKKTDIISAVIQIQSESKKGKWVKARGSWCTPGGDPVWECSLCGKGTHVYGIEHGTYGSDIADGQWIACPNCGAEMVGE